LPRHLVPRVAHRVLPLFAVDAAVRRESGGPTQRQKYSLFSGPYRRNANSGLAPFLLFSLFLQRIYSESPVLAAGSLTIRAVPYVDNSKSVAQGIALAINDRNRSILLTICQVNNCGCCPRCQ